MIEKIIKAVKSSNKKRSRNITIGAVVGFLLSCTAVMGAGDYLWIKGDKDGKIEFNTTATTDDDGSGGTWNTKNPYKDTGNIWDKDTETKTYINNITLLSSEKNGEYYDGYSNYDISYGLRLSGDLTDVNFVNNGSIIGIISGSSSSSSYGYGIYNLAIMGNIANTGVINGYGSSSSSYGYGYGIRNQPSATMGNITNTGLISGTGIRSSGYGFGYGIYNYRAGTMGAITNTGVISGTGISSSGSGYGIYNGSSSEIKDIINTGIISGSSSGYGIYNDSNTKQMGAITNIGIIYGTDNAIKNNSRTIGTINNYGILVNGSNNDVISNDLTLSNDY